LTDPLTGVASVVRAERAGEVAGLAHLGWIDIGAPVAYIG
jgi:hypothetical protein